MLVRSAIFGRGQGRLCSCIVSQYRHTAQLPIAEAAWGDSVQQQQDELSVPRACNVLMIYPRFQANTFWNFSEACKLLNARYPTAPLGLITVAAMLPANWNVRLVDRNAEEVTEADFAWADLVMTGGMIVQQFDALRV